MYWCTNYFVWALWVWLVGIDSKWNFTVHIIFLGLLHSPWIWCVSFWWDTTFSCPWLFRSKLQFWSSHRKKWLYTLLLGHLCFLTGTHWQGWKSIYPTSALSSPLFTDSYAGSAWMDCMLTQYLLGCLWFHNEGAYLIMSFVSHDDNFGHMQRGSALPHGLVWGGNRPGPSSNL